MARNRNTEERSVLALLYDDHRRSYPETAESFQREIEGLYQQLYRHPLANPEEIAAVMIGLCDDRDRRAYEEGIKCGVRLAIDLELESILDGGGCDVSDR